MDRSIVGFHLDDEGDWVAELDCGHRQHVRHRPPFQVRPWVLDENERSSHVGTPLDCPLCERAELPEGLRFVRRSPEWDDQSLPSGLRRAHKIASGTWGRLVVREGRIRFHACTSPPTDQLLTAGMAQPIPPDVEHEIELGADARFFIEFFGVLPFDPSRQSKSSGASSSRSGEGGDPACWAHLFCPACGRSLHEGHLEGCSLS